MASAGETNNDDPPSGEEKFGGEVSAEVKPGVGASPAGSINNYGTTIALNDARTKPRFPWRSDGVPLRLKVWGGEYDDALQTCLPPNAEQRASIQGREDLHSEKAEADEQDKSCIGDCCHETYLAFLKLRDFNPFFRAEIDFVARKFGSGVAQFFLLWRWMLTLNFIVFIWWFIMVMIPWFGRNPAFVDSDPAGVSFLDRDDLDWSTIFGIGRAASQSFMYYSGYTPYPSMGKSFRIGAVWILCVLVQYIFTFGVIMSKLVASVMSSEHDSEVQAKIKRAHKVDRSIAECIFSDFDFNMGGTEDGYKLQVSAVAMRLNTTLDDAFANIGTALFMSETLDLPTDEAGHLDDSDSVALAALHLEAEYRHRQRVGKMPAGKVTRGQTVAMLCCAGGYERYQQMLTLDKDLADAEAEIAAATAAVEKGDETKKDEEMGATATDDAVEEEGFFGGKTSKRKKAAEAKLAELQAFQATGEQTLDIYHHENKPSGVLLRRSLFRLACVKDAATGQILEVDPFEKWERVKDGEADLILNTMDRSYESHTTRSRDSEKEETPRNAEDTPNAEETWKKVYRGKHVDDLMHHIVSGECHTTAALSSLPSSYSTVGQITAKDGPGKKKQGTVWAEQELTTEVAAYLEERTNNKMFVDRCVYTAEHDNSVVAGDGDGVEEGGAFNTMCCGRFTSLAITILLIIFTAYSYAFTSQNSEYIINATGSASAPNSVLTLIKTVVPVVVTKLVVAEKWSSADKIVNEIVWRVFAIKMIALFYFAYHLKTSIQQPSDINFTNQCAASQIGDTYMNLVWVNTILGMVINFACYAGPYYLLGTKTKYDHNVVSLAYVELFYNQGLLWLGTPWAPMIPVIWVILASADCKFTTWLMETYCEASEKTYDGASSRSTVERCLVGTFFITLVPTMWFLNGDPSQGRACATYTNGVCTDYLPCGPIGAAHTYRYKALTDYVNEDLLTTVPGLSSFMKYATEPMVTYVVLLIFLAFCILQQFLLSQVRSEAAQAYDELSDTREERTREKKEAQDELLKLLG